MKTQATINGASVTGPPQKVSVVMMTPEWAAKLLKRNTINRPLRPKLVRFLVEEIKQGRWHLTTDAVGVRHDGELTNAQNRLTAIVEAGIAVPMLFVENLTDDSFLVTDRGITRTVGDVLRISPALAADATQIVIILGRIITTRVSPDVIRQIVSWWCPVYDDLLIHASKRSKYLANAATRVGVGVNLAIQTDLARREYVLEQYRALMGGGSMSRATGNFQHRMLTEKLGGGDRARRLRGCLLAYRSFDPDRRDQEVKLKNTETPLAELRNHLLAIEADHLATADRSVKVEPRPALGGKARKKYAEGKMIRSYAESASV